MRGPFLLRWRRSSPLPRGGTMTSTRATAIGKHRDPDVVAAGLFTIASAPVPPFLLNALCFGLGGVLGLLWTARQGFPRSPGRYPGASMPLERLAFSAIISFTSPRSASRLPQRRGLSPISGRCSSCCFRASCRGTAGAFAHPGCAHCVCGRGADRAAGGRSTLTALRPPDCFWPLRAP